MANSPESENEDMRNKWQFEDIGISFDQTDLNANLEIWSHDKEFEKAEKKKKKFKRSERGKNK